MARVFLSYAVEDVQLAEKIQVALLAQGFTVFFGDRLPPAGDYQSRIFQAIRKSDLLVFLASPAALQPGRFTLTELDWATARGPNPVGRVLTVLLGGTRPAGLPGYLQGATVLQPRGDVAAEVRFAVAALARQLFWRRCRRAAGWAVLAAAGAWGAWWLVQDGQGPVVDTEHQEPETPPVKPPNEAEASAPVTPPTTPPTESREARALRLAQTHVPAKAAPPRLESTAVDGCIDSTLFPVTEKRHCSLDAQRVVATAYCRWLGHADVAHFEAQFHEVGAPAYKLQFNVPATAADEALESSWRLTQNAGFRFTRIQCR